MRIGGSAGLSCGFDLGESGGKSAKGPRSVSAGHRDRTALVGGLLSADSKQSGQQRSHRQPSPAPPPPHGRTLPLGGGLQRLAGTVPPSQSLGSVWEVFGPT